jgi:hypothetical protein
MLKKFLDSLRPAYNLNININNPDYNKLANHMPLENFADFMLKLIHYQGEFVVFRDNRLSRGTSFGIETKIALLDISETENISGIKACGKVHAHLTDEKEKVIEYDLKKVY